MIYFSFKPLVIPTDLSSEKVEEVTSVAEIAEKEPQKKEEIENNMQGFKVGDFCVGVYDEDKIEYEAKILEIVAPEEDDGVPYAVVEFLG